MKKALNTNSFNVLALITLFLLIPSFTIVSIFAQPVIYVQDTIMVDTTWSADTVKVTGDIIIKDSVTLSLNPGTYVEFQGYYKLQIEGRLSAIGNFNEPIIFTVNDTTGFHDLNDTLGGWKGLYFHNTPANNDTSKMNYCLVEYAKKNDGGAIYLDNIQKIEIRNCTIQNNKASRGGGIQITNMDTLTISDNLIVNNEAFLGGGICITGTSEIIIRNNVFKNNSGGDGGAINIDGSANVLVNNNSICNNIVFDRGGGIYHSCMGTVSIVNNIIANNMAIWGGGVFNRSDIALLCNNTIVNNYAESQGGGIGEMSFNTILVNNIIWGNEINSGLNQIQELVNLDSAKYCNIQGGYQGEGNIDSMPYFISPSGGAGLDFDGYDADWSLRAISPCINKGTSEYNDLTEDIAGELRILMDTIDIGAYEFRNYAPEKIAEVPDQLIVAKLVCDIDIPVNDIFTDNNNGDILSYSVSAINPPAWLNIEMISNNINITGTPGINDAGVTETILTATDLFGAECVDTFEIEVTTENHPPVLENALTDIEVYVAENLNYIIPSNSFIDPDQNDILDYTAELEDGNELPEWLFFHSEAVTFTGIPPTTDIGILTIVVTATDLAFNIATDTFEIEVVQVTSIVSISDRLFAIYPVPADDVIYIESFDAVSNKFRIELIDIQGKAIRIRTLNKGDNVMKLNVSSIPAGLYYLSIRSDQSYKMYKITIQ